jgi:dienelactone hydrolase
MLQHGLGGRKEDVYLLSSALAKRGYASLMIDTAGHGARPQIGGKPVGELSLEQFRRMVGQTVADLRRGVDFLTTRPEIDTTRLGYLGASLGGIIGGVFVADESRIKGAVLWAAGGNWEKMIAHSQHKFAERYRTGPDAVPPAQVGVVMADVDPVKTVGSIAPRPLLLINGDKDTIVPTMCTDDLFAAAGDPKKRIVLSGGHVPDLSILVTESLSWLDAHIKPTVTADQAKSSLL